VKAIFIKRNKSMSPSHIQFGISFVEPSPNGGAYVLTRIATARFAILEISAADLVSLGMKSDGIPSLKSAHLVVVARTKGECLAAVEHLPNSDVGLEADND
jgi:hypothetical protein